MLVYAVYSYDLTSYPTPFAIFVDLEAAEKYVEFDREAGGFSVYDTSKSPGFTEYKSHDYAQVLGWWEYRDWNTKNPKWKYLPNEK